MPIDVDHYRKQYDKARDDLMHLFVLRYMWLNIVEMLKVRAGQHQDSLVRYWLETCYSRTIAVGIRRQAEGKGKRPTVGSLLSRVHLHAADFTELTCGFPAMPRREGDPWTGVYGQSGQHLDPQRVRALIDLIENNERRARDWVNSTIAHLDFKASVTIVTFADLDNALASLGEDAKFLYSLFYPDQSMPTLTPVTDLKWIETFTEAWYSVLTMQPIPESDPVITKIETQDGSAH